MSRRGGIRFAEKDVRQHENLANMILAPRRSEVLEKIQQRVSRGLQIGGTGVDLTESTRDYNAT
jgi:hypothetical protein